MTKEKFEGMSENYAEVRSHLGQQLMLVEHLSRSLAETISALSNVIDVSHKAYQALPFSLNALKLLGDKELEQSGTKLALTAAAEKFARQSLSNQEPKKKIKRRKRRTKAQMVQVKSKTPVKQQEPELVMLPEIE